MDLFADIVMFIGVVLIVIAAIGLHRFDNPFARMHATSKATSLGFALVAFGALIRLDTRADETQLLLAAVLMLITTPVGVHMLARAAYRSGDQLSPDTTVDELSPTNETDTNETGGSRGQ